MSRKTGRENQRDKEKDGKRTGLVQFVKFGLVGLMNTGVDFSVYTLSYFAGIHYLAAQAMGYAAGTVNSYFVNKYWTFGERGTGRKGQFFRFVLINAGTLLLSLGLLYLITNRLGFHPLLSKLAVTVVTVAANFAGSKLWVFRSVSDSQASAE